MKKFYKLSSSICLSLLAVGAMGQTLSHSIAPRKHNGVVLHTKGVPATHSAKKPMSGPTSFEMAYWVDDAQLITGGSAAYSITGISTTSETFFTDQLNGRFTAADTNAVTVPRQNFNLIRDAIVAFDTILDASVNSYTAAKGSMMIDTIWAEVDWKNTSGMNDTLVFSIDSVNPKGYPTATAYKTIMVPLYRDITFSAATPSGTATVKWSGYSLDTLQEMWCVPNFTLPYNTRYAVSVSFLGSKADTFEIGMGFPYTSCSSGGFDYANQFTQVGDHFTSAHPRTINANSFTLGWEAYYKNVPTMNPGTDGCIFESLFGSPNYEWNVCGSGGAGDTLFFYEQDYAIYSSVTFNDVTGIDNVTESGLSVGQNAPNPFNRSSQINYNMVKSSDVLFTIYDMTGRKLVETNYSNVAPGQHVINLNANQFTPGIYFYSFKVNGNEVTKRMVITQ